MDVARSTEPEAPLRTTAGRAAAGAKAEHARKHNK